MAQTRADRIRLTNPGQGGSVANFVELSGMSRVASIVAFRLRKIGLLALLVLAGLVQSGCAGSPDLTPNEAGALISRAPEFNRTRSLVRVVSTTRGYDSLDYCCYSAEFEFRSGSKTVSAKADFKYWDDHKWHLDQFYSGTPPTVEIVNIESDSYQYKPQ